jgi:two-component system CitB family sensor kinase
MWRTRTLASQILVGVLGILIVTTSVGGFLYVTLSSQTLDQQYEQRALGIADTVAQMPEIRDALIHQDPSGVIQARAEQIRRNSRAAYVVVADWTGLRYSHPNPRLIGQRLEEPVVVLDGHDHIGIDNGSLGRSANGKAPILAADGSVIGEVSVGILETEVAGRLHHELALIAAYSALALGLGAVASWFLARRIKRATFGLELSEITSLLQEREAMLHGIREGVIGFDSKGRVSVVNAEAQRLLRVGPGLIGKHIEQVIPAGRLQDLLTGGIEGADQVALTDDFLLVVNRMPVILGGRNAGSVVTLRDRSEMEALIRELRSINGLTAALRAQQHEYANRLHVMSGLLELGEQEEAANYLAEISRDSIAVDENLRSRIAPPMVAALLLGKKTIAAEQSVVLTVTADSHLDQPAVDTAALLTIIGNLVDNAIEALAGQPAPREITVRLDDADGVHLTVGDTGPGIPAADLDTVFLDGYSTKAPRGEMRRGLGLALVHRIVRRAGGTVTAEPGPGGHFDVRLPTPIPQSEPAALAPALDALP